MIETIKKIIDNIRDENIFNKICICINVIFFFLIASSVNLFFSYNYKVKYYYKKILLPCSIKKKNIKYFFQLNTFLELYEENEFLNEILDSDSDVFIDVGANIGRISAIATTYNLHYKKIIALEPNKNCILLVNSYIPKEIRKNVIFEESGLGDNTETKQMFIDAKDTATTMATLEKERSCFREKEDKDIAKITVNILSFNDFFNIHKLSSYKTFFLKIDVEGYEEHVLVSFFQFIKQNEGRYKFKVILEILPFNKDLFVLLGDFGIKRDKIKQLGKGNDYLFYVG